jgi:predicted GTPase
MDRSDDPSKEVVKRNCCFIGKQESGKTTIFHAVSRTTSMPMRDCDDGSKACETNIIEDAGVTFGFVDTIGFRGVAGEDRAVYDKILREIKRLGELNVIFVVCKFKRFEAADSAVISFIRHCFSPAAKEKMWLVIMSCLESERDKAISQLVTPQRYKIVNGIENRVLT